MKRDDFIQGATYLVRLTSGKWIKATYNQAVQRGGGSWGREMTHWLFTSQATGRAIEIKSRVRIKQAQGLHTPGLPK